jgi:uncharacterized protein YgiM (DUF1202 family)
MYLKTSKYFLACLIVVFAVTSQACGVSQKATPAMAESPTSFTATADIQNTIPTASATVPSTPTLTVVPSLTSPTVTVTAVNGKLAIRSGPDMTFDAIATLNQGETVTALARSILNGWIQVPIPSRDGETGWVSTLTDYSTVSGNVLDLPRIDVVEWPVGSYLVNCTTHQMVVEPGDKTLQPVSDSPENRVWFSPGLYKIYDFDVSGHPQVKDLNLLSRTEVKIIKDGDGQESECP